MYCVDRSEEPPTRYPRNDHSNVPFVPRFSHQSSTPTHIHYSTLEDCSGDDRFAGEGERDNCCSDIVFCYGVRCAFRCYSTECEIRIDSGMHFHLHNTIIGMSGSTLQYFPM